MIADFTHLARNLTQPPARSERQSDMKKWRFIALSSCAALLFGADPALTIYNQNFAVIRETLPLDLKAGNNTVNFDGATAQVEPDSVILRDPTGARPVQILEQNYRNDPISQDRLLSLYEGKTIDFAIYNNDGTTSMVSGKIIRGGVWDQPLIEVNGKLQFSLPGEPIFPALVDDTILKPALDWILYSPRAAKFNAELSYISGGLSWTSAYNIIASDSGDAMDLVGWVTLDNQSGKQFDHARIKLMAGDVNKVQPLQIDRFFVTDGTHLGVPEQAPQVTEKTFEDYHLYTLPLSTTIHDRETKQVEFLRASGIQSKRLYVYDGAQSNSHVWIMREFVNSIANHLGIPLPAGRVRFYRQDQDGQVEFTGENKIEHTPKDETLRIYTGNAFDITGERRQTKFVSDVGQRSEHDSFEIKLRNHKAEAATVRVVEHLYRSSNWAITEESATHRQTDSKTIEYEVTLQPNEERTVTYTAHYSW